MSQSCVKTSVFDNIIIENLSKTSKTTLEEIKILYGNAKFYYSTNEFSGALVSYSCAAVLLNAMLRELSSENTTNQLPVVSPESSPPVSRTPSNTSTTSPIDTKTQLTDALNCCLIAVEILQKKVGSGRPDGEKDEKKDWEKICTKLQPLVFSKGSSNCLFFSGVAGMKREKQLFKSSLIFPLMYPRLYPKASKGILIYGPPGTGKTFIVKAAVNELQKTDPNIGILFFTPSPGDLKGKYVGQTEKKIEEWFTCASKAACDAQLTCGGNKQFISVMFMDEFDAIAPDRNTDKSGLAANSVNTLLQMMDGINSKQNVTVIAATNYPWNLDAAILRRFDTQILVDVPDEGDILELLNMEMKNIIKFRENKQKNAYCNSEMEKYKKNNEIEVDSKPNVVCEHECVDEPPKDLTVSYPYNQMRYDFYDDIEGKDYRTGVIISIEYGDRTSKTLGTREIISCKIKFDDNENEIDEIPYKEITHLSKTIGAWAPDDKVKVGSSKIGGFVDGLVQKLKADNFSNSDIGRLIKTANTYTGQICVEGNLFYSTKVFLHNFSNEELFVSCVTKLRKQRTMIEYSVKLLKWYLSTNTNATIINGIYQLKKPDIVSITYRDKVYLNTKCLLCKPNELVIEDPSIKEIFIECPAKFATISGADVDLTQVNYLNEYVVLYQNFIEDRTLYDVILVFDFSIKQMDTGFVENAAYPISRNLIDSVFKPINNIFQNTKQVIVDIEKTEESVNKTGVKPTDNTSEATDNTSEATDNTSKANNLTDNINRSLNLSLTDGDIKAIKSDVMFNIIDKKDGLVPVEIFFTEGLKKIVNTKLENILAPAIENFNLLNNDYTLYKVLLLLQAAENLYKSNKVEAIEAKVEAKVEDKAEDNVESILNDSMLLYLNSFYLNGEAFELVKKNTGSKVSKDTDSKDTDSKDTGSKKTDSKDTDSEEREELLFILKIQNINTDTEFYSKYHLTKNKIELSVYDFLSFAGEMDIDMITTSLLAAMDYKRKKFFEKVYSSYGITENREEYDKIVGLFAKLSNNYTIHIKLDLFVTLYGKYINIQELNKKLTRNQNGTNRILYQATPYNNFTDNLQVLMQLYFNDIVDFCLLDPVKNETTTKTYLTNFFPKNNNNNILYYAQLICKRILDNYIYIDTNGKTNITSLREVIQPNTLKLTEELNVEGNVSNGGSKKKKRLIHTSDSKKKIQNSTLSNKLPKQNKSNKRNVRSTKINEKKYIKIHYGGAPNDNEKANDVFISFCTDSIPNTFAKKIAEKRIFVKTQYNLNELKIQHKSGIINLIYYEGSSVVKSIYDYTTKGIQERNADQKSTQTKMAENLKRKNQFLAVIFKKVTAVGFLMADNTNNVVDDNDILSKENSNSKEVVINWIPIDEKSQLFEYVKSSILPIFAGVAKYIEGVPPPDSAVANAAAGPVANAAEVGFTIGTPIGFMRAIWSSTVSSINSLVKLGASLITDSVATALIIAFAAYESFQFYTAESLDNSELINNFLLYTIMNIITDIRYITTKTFNKKPSLVFKEFLDNKLEQTSGILKRIVKTAEKLVTSSSVFNNETINYPIVLYNKANIAEPSDIKDKLTNLNIPFRAFAYALTTVKSTYVKETGELLKDYYDNKDKFMEKWKKKQKEKG